MAKAPPKAARPLKRELARHAEIARLLDEHKAAADPLRREQAELEKKFEAWLREAEPDKLRATLFDRFTLFVEHVKASVRWKDAFVEHAGAEKAAELTNQAGTRERFGVEHAG